MSNPTPNISAILEAIVKSKPQDLLNEWDELKAIRAWARKQASATMEVGDRVRIDGVPGVAIECKAVRAMDLAGWMTEAKREAENAGGKLAVVVAKRRMASVSRAYVVMELEQWCQLAKGSE